VVVIVVQTAAVVDCRTGKMEKQLKYGTVAINDDDSNIASRPLLL